MYIPPVWSYPIIALLLPIMFYFINRKLIWASLPIALIVDLAVYWKDFAYYESRPFLIFFTLAQLLVMLIDILILKFIGRKTAK